MSNHNADNAAKTIRRNREDCIYIRPRGKKTRYCSVDENDKIKQCHGVCNLFKHTNELLNQLNNE